MKSRLTTWLTPIGLSVAVATASLLVMRVQKTTVLADDGTSYAEQKPSPTPHPMPMPSASPSPSPEMSPTPMPSPEPSPEPSPSPTPKASD